jgi:L-fuconolactonase
MSGPSNAAHPPYFPIRPEWLAQNVEPIIDPERQIVDPHHHLWDLPDRRYLLDQLLADTGSGHRITGTVFIQCWTMQRNSGPDELRPVGETEFANGIAAMSASGDYGPTRVCEGIVAYADLLRGAAVQSVLDAHRRAGGDRLRGIRHITAWDEEVSIRGAYSKAFPGMLSTPEFREGFACLARNGMSFDACIFHTQIDELTEIAGAFPGTSIVLDHIGLPLHIGRFADRDAEVLANWRLSLRRLAKCENVTIKIGGFAQRFSGWNLHERPNTPSSEELASLWRPYVETCIEAFGANRCMFESNFPVDKAGYSYSACWNAFKRLTASCTDAEKDALFSDTARRIYRLKPADAR